jgi:hypothetical protein
MNCLNHSGIERDGLSWSFHLKKGENDIKIIKFNFTKSSQISLGNLYSQFLSEEESSTDFVLEVFVESKSHFMAINKDEDLGI